MCLCKKAQPTDTNKKKHSLGFRIRALDLEHTGMLLQTLLLTKINSHYVKSHTGNVLSDLWTASCSHNIPNLGPLLLGHTPGMDRYLLPLPHHLEKRIFFWKHTGEISNLAQVQFVLGTQSDEDTEWLQCLYEFNSTDYSKWYSWIRFARVHTNNFTRAFLLFRLRFYKTFYCTPHVSII